MKVRALKLGYYDNRRQKEGAQFYLQDPKHFSEKWMEKVEKKSQPSPAKKSSKKVEEKLTDSEVI